MGGRTYLLVHGAWHGAWAWDETKKRLESQGHTVYAVDLPGHGADKSPVTKVTFRSYVTKVLTMLHDIEGRIILVGHSLGGFVITQVAEIIPDRIERLIFVAAMVPYVEKNVVAMLGEDEQSKLLSNLQFSEDKSLATVSKDALREVIYNDVTLEKINRYAPLLVNQATEPFYATVKITRKFSAIPKTYIACSLDKLFSIGAQRKTIKAINCKHAITLTAGHAPMLSQPENLADALEQLMDSTVL